MLNRRLAYYNWAIWGLTFLLVSLLLVMLSVAVTFSMVSGYLDRHSIFKPESATSLAPVGPSTAAGGPGAARASVDVISGPSGR